LEKRWSCGNNGEDQLGIGLEKDRLKVACLKMEVIPFQAMCSARDSAEKLKEIGPAE